VFLPQQHIDIVKLIILLGKCNCIRLIFRVDKWPK
jgi:hypothetical protein